MKSLPKATVQIDLVETQPIDVMSTDPPETPTAEAVISPDHSAEAKRATYQHKPMHDKALKVDPDAPKKEPAEPEKPPQFKNGNDFTESDSEARESVVRRALCIFH